MVNLQRHVIGIEKQMQDLKQYLESKNTKSGKGPDTLSHLQYAQYAQITMHTLDEWVCPRWHVYGSEMIFSCF